MRYTSSELFQISELQSNAFWDIRFTDGILKDYSEALEKRVVTSELPKATVNNITANMHGYEFEIPGTINYKSQITITYVEPVDVQVAQAVDAWYKRIYKTTPGDVKGVQEGTHQSMFVDFELIPKNREDKDTQIFLCKKAIINSFDPGGSLEDGSSPDIWKPSMTLTVNWYTWESKGLSPS